MGDPMKGLMARSNGALLVLSILKEGKAHGYAIAAEIQRRSEKSFEFKQGTLYPLLHELEKDGLITSEWEILDGERPRRVYTLTEDGVREADRRIEAWLKHSRMVAQVMGVRLDEGS